MKKGGAQRILADLRSARALVIHTPDEDRQTLVDHLKRLGCTVSAVWPLPAALPPDVDTIFIQVEDIPFEQIATVLDGRDPAIIAIVTYESPTSLKAIVDLNAHGVLSKPLRLAGVLNQFALARYRHGFEKRLTAKVSKLEETLKGRRLVDKAVKLLMRMNELDEDIAYQRLRDQATARRLPMTQVAQTIVSAHEILDGSNLTLSYTPQK